MRFLFVVLAFLVQAEADTNPQVDAYLERVLELFKAQMPTGIPDLGIPVLDPFEVPHFDIPHIQSGYPLIKSSSFFFFQRIHHSS